MSEFLEKAVMAHNLWKGKLRDAIVSGNTPDEATTRADNACDLGKWLHGEGAQYSAKAEYQDVMTCHKSFHQSAADVVKLIKAGKKDDAAKSLDQGDFAKCSVNCVLAIGKLKKIHP